VRASCGQIWSPCSPTDVAASFALFSLAVKSASFILLQAVPGNISLDELRSALLVLPGVVSVHEVRLNFVLAGWLVHFQLTAAFRLHQLHCWQLSETKVVASVHVLLEKEAEYMETLHSIREGAFRLPAISYRTR
jgi:zinc transporter 1